MIGFTSEDGNPEMFAETTGFGIYLDNDSLIDLAKGDPSRRTRFVDLLQVRATLLFSWANAVEIARPLGRSAGAVRALLDSIGPHWVPLQFNPWEVMRREQAGLTAEAAVSTTFMEAYFQPRTYDLATAGRVLDLSSDAFFRLGAVVDWVHEHREKIRADSERLDNELCAVLRSDGPSTRRIPHRWTWSCRLVTSMTASRNLRAGPSPASLDQRCERVSLQA